MEERRRRAAVTTTANTNRGLQRLRCMFAGPRAGEPGSPHSQPSKAERAMQRQARRDSLAGLRRLQLLEANNRWAASSSHRSKTGNLPLTPLTLYIAIFIAG